MSDYTIGAITLPSEDPEGIGEVIHFAVLPFKGKMTRRGPEGLGEILGEITRQYLEHALTVDFDELRRWLRVLTERDSEFNRTEIQMKDSAPAKAVVTDLYSGDVEEIGSPEDLAAFIYSGPRR